MRRRAVTVLLVLTAACSPAPAPVSQSTNDPSNPAAPDGRNPLAAPASAPPPVTSAPPHRHEHMHP